MPLKYVWKCDRGHVVEKRHAERKDGHIRGGVRWYAFCEQCNGPRPIKKNDIEPRPNIEAMSQEEYDAFLLTPRICTGCTDPLLTKHFEIVRERGRKVVRSRCKDCMKRYYSTTKTQRAHRYARKNKYTISYGVQAVAANEFAVVRSLNDCEPRVVSTWDTDHQAEIEARRLVMLWHEGK